MGVDFRALEELGYLDPVQAAMADSGQTDRALGVVVAEGFKLMREIQQKKRRLRQLDPDSPDVDELEQDIKDLVEEEKWLRQRQFGLQNRLRSVP